jgi:GNAT superfamily N-acetyltransferase
VTAPCVIGALTPAHDRLNFACGVEALDRYLQQQAGQDIRRRVSNCFVANPQESPTIVAGYYTLAAASIPVVDLPDDVTKRLPRYPVLPAALIRRLAVSRVHQGRALGAALLFDAIHRTWRADPAVFALLVDAKDDRAAEFYRHFGFVNFSGRQARLFLPLATAAKLMKN